MKISEIAALPVFHYAGEFPYISNEEILSLAEDIEKNGLIHPIVLWNGMLLDGRNRLKAIIEHKVRIDEIPTVDFEGTELDAADRVNSYNMHRRDLDASKRAVIGVRYQAIYEADGLKKMLAGKADPDTKLCQGEEKKRAPQSSQLAAERVGASKTNVEIAKKLSINAPELLERVAAGEIKLNKANDAYKFNTADIETKRAFFKQFPDIWNQYQSGELDVNQAYFEAKKEESAQKKAREKVVSDTIIKVEQLEEIVLIRTEAINKTIGAHCQTTLDCDEVLELIHKMESHLAVTKNALAFQIGILSEGE